MGDVVEINKPVPGNQSFLCCSCGKEELLVVCVHDAAGAFISTLVCAECDSEIPISYGRPPTKSSK